MKVSDIMTRDVHLLSPDQTIREAASIMADIDAGALPVGENDRLVGIVSLGDLARNDDPATIGRTVSRVSTPGGKHDQSGTH
jgi:CBS domain-containing protein